MKPKYLIINADDFGWSRKNVDSIISLHNKGLITSTSVMTTMPAYEYGLEKLRLTPSLGAGVHMSIFDGKPVLPPEQVQSLINRETGEFLSFDDVKRLRRRLNGKEAAAEYRAQIELFLESGIEPTHIDVHTMLPYIIPSWFNRTAALAAEYKLPMRTVIGRDLKEKSPELAKKAGIPRLPLRIMGQRIIKRMDRDGIARPDYFISEFSDNDIYAEGSEKASLLCSIFSSLNSGITELLTHPSSGDDAWRRIEWEAWNNPGVKQCLEQSNIKLVNYGILKTM